MWCEVQVPGARCQQKQPKGDSSADSFGLVAPNFRRSTCLFVKKTCRQTYILSIKHVFSIRFRLRSYIKKFLIRRQVSRVGCIDMMSTSPNGRLPFGFGVRSC